jgi:hypothetical protein
MQLGVDTLSKMCYNSYIETHTGAHTMTTLNVHFVNRGYGSDDGFKTVELVKLDIYETTGQPMAAVKSPYFPGDTLVAMFENNEWLCDLD